MESLNPLMPGRRNSCFTTIDLFSGVGGFSEGFKKAGFKILSAVEYDPDIAHTYAKNHDDTKMIIDDIANVSSPELLASEKEVDVIIGGPPCQGFSMAGKRIRENGAFLNDPRNELFKEFHRVIVDLNPSVFVMENVAAILSMQNGKVAEEILKTFKGYNVKVKVLKAADYGVPQLRQRALFIGNRLGIDSNTMFPEKTHGSDAKKPYVTVAESIFDLPYINAGEGHFESTYDKSPSNLYQRERRRKSKKLYNHKASFHDERIIAMLKIIKEGHGRTSLPRDLQTKSVHSGAFGRMARNQPAYTITTRFDTPSVGRVTHPLLNRSLTPREAARLQSFDDNFVFYGSKSSIGMQIGNAVPPLLAYAIAKKIRKVLENYAS